jgi:hypothetical protein
VLLTDNTDTILEHSVDNDLRKAFSMSGKFCSDHLPFKVVADFSVSEKTNAVNKKAALKEELRQSVDTDQVNYETKIACDRSFSKIYKYLKCVKKQSPVHPTILCGDVTASTDARKANMFNDYFASVFSPVSNVACDRSPDSSELTLEFEVTAHTVADILHTLDTTKARGPDNMPPLLLKNTADAIAPSLRLLFHTCQSKGVFLTRWKKAQLSPLCKAGSRLKVENYRPISLYPYYTVVASTCYTYIVTFYSYYAFSTSNGISQVRVDNSSKVRISFPMIFMR